MPDYSLGKVYKIVGNGKVYVGSTTRPLLCQRMTCHRSNFKRWKNGTDVKRTCSSYECIEDPECYIELLESCPCNSKDELHKCESKWIRSLECVNRRIEDRTKQEWYQDHIDEKKEYDKTYREQNKERKKENDIKYQMEHKDEKKEYDKLYREKNKERIKQIQKEYHEKNKEQMNKACRDNYYKRKLLASNNSIPIDPANLSVEPQTQESTLIIEHKEE